MTFLYVVVLLLHVADRQAGRRTDRHVKQINAFIFVIFIANGQKSFQEHLLANIVDVIA
jgi:hypothetical protein